MYNYIPLEQAADILDSYRKPVNNKERLNLIKGKPLDELFPYYGATGQVGWIDSFLTDGEYILLGEDGAPFLNPYAEKAYIIYGKTWVNNHAHILRSKTNNEFLCYYLNYFNYKNYVSGTTRLKLTQAQMRKIPIPNIPSDEQFRIVARIEELFSELDKAVDTLKTTKKQLVVYRQAILQQAFIGNSNYHKRKSSISKTEFKPVDAKELVQLASLPQEWKYVYLSDLGNLSRGKSSHRPRNDPKLFENGVYPFFQTGDVKGAQKDLYNCEKKYNDVGLAQSKLWPAGTLCITIAANIAETCFLGVDGCFPDSIVGFIPNDNLVLKEYIRFFIDASKLKLWAYAPATAQKNINLSTLENLIVPYCAIEEQQYIVQKIEEIDSVCNKLEQTIDTALAQVDAMRQSILKQAFEGAL